MPERTTWTLKETAVENRRGRCRAQQRHCTRPQERNKNGATALANVTGARSRSRATSTRRARAQRDVAPVASPRRDPRREAPGSASLPPPAAADGAPRAIDEPVQSRDKGDCRIEPYRAHAHPAGAVHVEAAWAQRPTGIHSAGYRQSADEYIEDNNMTTMFPCVPPDRFGTKAPSATAHDWWKRAPKRRRQAPGTSLRRLCQLVRASE